MSISHSAAYASEIAELLADLKPCASNEEAMNQWTRTVLAFIGLFDLDREDSKEFANIATLEHYS